MNKQESQNQVSIIVNGVVYVAVDTPIETDKEYNCLDCDIYKIRPPQRMCTSPICCDKGYGWVNLSCCAQFNRNIHRVWKIK